MTTQAVKRSPTASRRPRLPTPVSLRIAQPSIPRSEHLHRNPSKTLSPFPPATGSHKRCLTPSLSTRSKTKFSETFNSPTLRPTFGQRGNVQTFETTRECFALPQQKQQITKSPSRYCFQSHRNTQSPLHASNVKPLVQSPC